MVSRASEIRIDVLHLAYLLIGFLDALCYPNLQSPGQTSAFVYRYHSLLTKELVLLNRSISCARATARGTSEVGKQGRVKAESRCHRALRAWEARNKLSIIHIYTLRGRTLDVKISH